MKKIYMTVWHTPSLRPVEIPSEIPPTDSYPGIWHTPPKIRGYSKTRASGWVQCPRHHHVPTSHVTVWHTPPHTPGTAIPWSYIICDGVLRVRCGVHTTPSAIGSVIDAPVTPGYN